MENDNIRADGIEATEFPAWTAKYGVHAVPKTIVNESFSIEGSLPEERFLDEILRAIQPPDAAVGDDAGIRQCGPQNRGSALPN
jgi:hypothetical protein